MDTKELSYEVIKPIGIISEKNNYTKKHPLKGISMSKADLVALKELLSQVDLGV